MISMLHHYLEKNPVKNIVLFADNCVGQNKNNALLHYLLWRILTSRNETISFNFLLTGHTKFSSDRNFGVLKAKYAKAIVDCQEDLIEVVNKSSPVASTLLFLVKIHKKKYSKRVMEQVGCILKTVFQPIISLTKYHHFDFHADCKIIAKVFDNSPEVIVRKESGINLLNSFPL